MQNDSNRRNFLKGSTAAAAGAALTSTIARTAHAAGSDEIKFVLVFFEVPAQPVIANDFDDHFNHKYNCKYVFAKVQEIRVRV